MEANEKLLLPNLENIRFYQNRDVAIIKFSNPNSRVNCYSLQFLNDMIEVQCYLRDHESELNGAVLISDKPDNFFAGADLKDFNSQTKDTMDEFSAVVQGHMRFFLDWNRPVISAVNGGCLGAGLEMVLGSQYVIAIDSDKTIFSCPETMIGLIPGAGGSQLLPRRINLHEALTMLVSGKRISARDAFKLNLVNRLLDPADYTIGAMEQLAIDTAIDLFIGKMSYPKMSLYDSILLRSMSVKLIRDFVFNKYRSEVLTRTRGHYPAPLRALDAAKASFELEMEEAFQLEVKIFSEVAVTPQAQNLIRLFNLQSECKKNIHKQTEPERQLERRESNSSNGSQTKTIFSNYWIISDGSDPIKAEQLSQFCGARVIELHELEHAAAPRNGLTAVFDCVSENLDTKREFVQLIESIFGSETNPDNYIIVLTSPFQSVSEITANCSRPAQVTGVRFFSPIRSVPMVELISPDSDPNNSNQVSVSLVADWLINKGKAIINSADRIGFSASRLLSVLVLESLLILKEYPISIEKLEDLCKDIGFSYGVLSCSDVLGLDNLLQIHERISDDQPELIRQSDVQLLRSLVSQGCLGRRNGSGFFNYESSGKKSGPNPIAKELVQKLRPKNVSEQIDEDLIKERIILSVVNEGYRCLNEKILHSESEGDLCSVVGLGFPPFLGGSFNYVNSEGKENIIERLFRLEKIYGSRFRPEILIRMRSDSDGLCDSEKRRGPLNKL